MQVFRSFSFGGAVGVFVSYSRVGEGQQFAVGFQDVRDDIDQSLSQGRRQHADLNNVLQLVEDRQQIVVAELGLVAKQILDQLHHLVWILWKRERTPIQR